MTAAQPQRFSFSTRTGAALVGYHWPSDPGFAPTAERSRLVPLVLVHGFGEHARRLGSLASAAAAAGHDVYACDLEGHGESSGARAIVAGFEGPLAAVTALIERAVAVDAAQGVSTTHPAKPVLYGHSMGGAIALSFALDHPDTVAGLVLSAPALIDAVKRPALLVSLAGPVARLVPALSVAKLDVTRISRDPAEVARYQEDPLIHHGGVPAVTGYTITSQGERLLTRAGELAVPTLVVHGEADGLIDVEGSRRLAAGAPPGMVELHTFPDGYHELHHDLASTGVRERLRSLVLDFLARRGSPVPG